MELKIERLKLLFPFNLEIRAFRNEYRIIICRTAAKEKKPPFLLVQKRESLPKDMAAKGVSRHEMQTVSTKFIGH